MRSRLLAALLLIAFPACISAQKVPDTLIGTWRVERILPTRNPGCWNGKQGEKMLHTTLTYTRNTLRWHGENIPITETIARSVTAKEFHLETMTTYKQASDLSELGIHSTRVTELDLQHDDVDVTDVTTEAPGDTVLVLAPGRMIFSVCGTYFEASRVR